MYTMPFPFPRHSTEFKDVHVSNLNKVNPEFSNYKVCINAANVKVASINTMNELNFYRNILLISMLIPKIISGSVNVVKRWITDYVSKRQNQGCMIKASSDI